MTLLLTSSVTLVGITPTCNASVFASPSGTTGRSMVSIPRRLSGGKRFGSARSRFASRRASSSFFSSRGRVPSIRRKSALITGTNRKVATNASACSSGSSFNQEGTLSRLRNVNVGDNSCD